MADPRPTDDSPREEEGPAWAIVMAGGSGTRFWPASRAARPKQLLPLLADDDDGGTGDVARAGRSLLAATVARIEPLIAPERVIVVASAALADATRRELPRVPPENVLAEPAPQGTSATP